jgi:hypothetical protein
MRLSVDTSDPGYHPQAASGNVKVFFDGSELSGCVTADEEQGVAVRFKKDSKGQYVLTPDCDDVEKETLHGKVVIRCPWAWRCDPQDEISAR